EQKGIYNVSHYCFVPNLSGDYRKGECADRRPIAGNALGGCDARTKLMVSLARGASDGSALGRYITGGLSASTYHWVFCVRSAAGRWLHCPAGDVVACNRRANSGAHVPARLLKGFTGVIHADGYSGFNELFAGNRITEAGCWAHYLE